MTWRPIHDLRRKYRRAGLPVPEELAYHPPVSNPKPPRSRATGRPTGRPRTSTHPRAEYWRNWYARRRAMTCN